MRWKDILKKVREKIEVFRYRLSYDWCYDQEEAAGHAVFGMCGGVVGGTKATDYLSEHCIGCPHYQLGWEYREEESAQKS